MNFSKRELMLADAAREPERAPAGCCCQRARESCCWLLLPRSQRRAPVGCCCKGARETSCWLLQVAAAREPERERELLLADAARNPHRTAAGCCCQGARERELLLAVASDVAADLGLIDSD